MANFKRLSEAELRKQFREAGKRETEAEKREHRAKLAHYDRATRMIHVQMRNGAEFLIPARLIEYLKGAKPEQLEQIDVSPLGTGLHWPALDVSLDFQALLEGVFGGAEWMRSIAAQALGRKTSKAKSAASRANGAKGGRPRKTAAKKTRTKSAK
jgi:hypothetical protein